MATSVTIAGGNHQVVTLGFDPSSNLLLAQQVAALLQTGIADGKIVAENARLGLPQLPLGVEGAAIQSSTPVLFMQRDYPIDLVTHPGETLVFGNGQPNEIVMSGSATDLTFLGLGGSGTVNAGGGNNTITVVADRDTGNRWHHRQGTDPSGWVIFTGGGNDRIDVIGSANATIGAGGGKNSIALGNGSYNIISTGDDTIVGGGGSETVDASRARADFVQGNQSDLTFVGGSGGATILGGQGSDTYLGSAGPTGKQYIQGGQGGDNLLFAGDGLATLVGGGSGDQLYAYGTAAQLLQAGAGRETLSAAASTGADTLKAAGGHDLLIGGDRTDTFVAGSGHTTINAGPGREIFEFVRGEGGGTELVTGIDKASDISINLSGFGREAVNQALASQTVSHGSVSISLTDGTRVTFEDITSLTKSNFV